MESRSSTFGQDILYLAGYHAFLVEDSGYCWTHSRYIHLNPCHGNRPLVDDPGQWTHSSFAGYARKSKRMDWFAYDQLLALWKAAQGKENQNRAYRKFVQEAMMVPRDRFKQVLREGGSPFGLSGIDSVSNLIRLGQKRFDQSHQWKQQVKQIEASLHLNTESKA